jgi:hypothetical protein
VVARRKILTEHFKATRHTIKRSFKPVKHGNLLLTNYL